MSILCYHSENLSSEINRLRVVSRLKIRSYCAILMLGVHCVLALCPSEPLTPKRRKADGRSIAQPFANTLHRCPQMQFPAATANRSRGIAWYNLITLERPRKSPTKIFVGELPHARPRYKPSKTEIVQKITREMGSICA